MIDQETAIRIALIENVHALVSDVNLIKKSLAGRETTIVGLHQTVQELNFQVDAHHACNFIHIHIKHFHMI